MRQYQIIFGTDDANLETADGLRAAKQFELKDARRKSFFHETSKSETANAARENFSQISSPAEDESKQKFGLLLAQLDRIVCLDEMSDNLEELDRAVEIGNATRIGALARECAEMCSECEMPSAVEPLLELARLCRRNQTARAAALCARIRNEFERRRTVFKSNLRRLAGGGKTSRRAFV